MLQTTEGIVFNCIKYKETSVITKIFTRELGLKSYILNGVRSGKGNKIAFFQPLTLLSLVVYHKERTAINRISEVRCPEPYMQLTKDPTRTLISFFLAEVLNKSLKEETVNEELFLFLKDSFQLFDRSEKTLINFHLVFLLKLSVFLGFGTSSEEQVLEICSDATFSEEEKILLQDLMVSGYNDEISLGNLLRRKILKLFLHFYALNIENMPAINSARIINEVLSG